MKLIDAFTVDDTALADSNVLEAVPTAYNAGTTYAADAIVSVSGSNGAHTVYQSLQAGNTGNTPASSPLWWSAKGTVYNAYSSGHALDEIVTDTTNHRLYKSKVGANSNPLPAEDINGNPTSDTNWAFQRASSRWAPFDKKNGTVATWEGELTYELDFLGRITAIQLLNLTGASVNLTIIGEGAAEVFNEDRSLIDLNGIVDEWAWCFMPPKFIKDTVFEDLPLDINPTATITLTGDGDVSVGTINPGFAQEIGKTQKGARAGNRTFSVIEEDAFGVTGVTPRETVKKMTLRVWVDAENTDFVFNLLDSYDATPVGVIGSSQYGSLNQFGLIRSWEEAIEDPGPYHTIVDVEFESL